MKYLLLNPSADFHFNSPHPPKFEYWYFKINKAIMVRIFVKLTSSLVISSKTLYNNRSSRPEVFLGKGVLKICSRFINKAVKHLYWNCTSAWVFSCHFAAYFQNTFSLNTYGWLLLFIKTKMIHTVMKVLWTQKWK